MPRQVEGETNQEGNNKTAECCREPSPRAYYEEYLRRKYADWDDIQIERKAVLDLEDTDFRELIEMQLKWYRDLKNKHPDLDIDSWWWPGSEDSNEEAS